ncbi:hydrogenase large subunit [Castellaniella caeni]|uniref:hydrogenase large subunit n=1 Tax=Castellaniella caeni TaxID=266123 RepID=UPI000A02F17E|nr:NADH-quinone oxidoreductase subunit C [Castellaniella caeni]
MSVHRQWLARLCAQLPKAGVQDVGPWVELRPPLAALRTVAAALVTTFGCEFATLVTEACDADDAYVLRYFFYQPQESVLVAIRLAATGETPLPAIGSQVHAAAWHERETEDLFGIPFAGHPFLGDYVLHDALWPEHLAPMRHGFDARQRVAGSGVGAAWQPRRILQQEGAITFPVGPIWADDNEAGLWLLETPGEQILGGLTRLFYKYRAVEKIAEGLAPGRALLLAERFSGSAAFAHAYAFCRALEAVARCQVPPRAHVLRAVFAELERIRYHAATIAELAGSTSLAVGKSMSQELEERLLRLSAQVCGHRYLFGLCVPGGLALSPGADALAVLRAGIADAADEFARLERLFVRTSSYLDRIEEMGVLRPDVADLYGVVGPVARASGRTVDLRRALPYGVYATRVPEIACETEGDGYARLRVYFAEVRASVALIQTLLAQLPQGAVSTKCRPAAGAAMGWVEAPAGGTFHWLRVDEDGLIRRWRIAPPGFRNWHAFHRALEGAAFQDFHIIMASFGLSVAESDR